jgi:hypothetical protein
MTMFNRPIIHAAAAVLYRTEILNPDGTLARARSFKRNLILDQGLNLVATTQWAACFAYCAVGTGTTATKRDSGSVTFSRSGTTVTASAGFFDSADTGRLLKWDTGQECYLTYVNATTCTSNLSGTIGAAEGTVWYVNQTALTTETARTNSLSGDGGANGTTFTTDTYTHKRTFLFPAVVSGVTYNEIGWSPSGSGNLFGRDTIPGGDMLAAGQQYKVVVQLLITISPVASTAQGDVGNNGFNTAGNYNHEYVGNAYSIVESNGNTTAGGLEPAQATRANLVAGSFTLLSSPSYTVDYVGDFGSINLTNLSYTNGNFYRDSQGTVVVADGNSADLRAIVFGLQGGFVTNRNLSLRFTAAQTKDSDHTVKITLRKSWGRILVN